MRPLQFFNLFVVATVVAALWAGSGLIHNTVQGVLKKRAEATATTWANLFSVDGEYFNSILERGRLTDVDIARLESFRKSTKIFYFKLYEASGRQIVVSDNLTNLTNMNISPGEHSPTAHSVVLTGQPFTEISDGTNKPSRPNLYAESYVPISYGGSVVGVVESYIDVSEAYLELKATAKKFASLIGGMVLLVGLLPVLGISRIWMKLARSNRDLDLASKRAKAAEEAKSAFLANMSHEIRTPMNGIIAMSELLEESELTTEQQVYARTVSQSSAALLAIINDVLDFSKIEAGKMELQNSSFCLLEQVESIAFLFAPRAGEKSVEISVGCSIPGPFHVIADKNRVRQCLLNVVGNAVKFTPEGHVHIQVDAGGTRGVNISVSDTGIGIPEDKIDQVFHEFAQVDDTSSRSFEGTGLGLAITQHLTQLMDGTLQVRSVERQGSTFEFNFPFELDAAGKKDQALWSSHCEFLAGKRVFVVENHAKTRASLSVAVEQFSARCEIAANGKEALAALERMEQAQCLPDVCIVPSNLADINAAQFQVELQRLGLKPSFPCVLALGSDFNIPSNELIEHGYTGSLRKPLKRAALGLELCKALGMKAVSEIAQPAESKPALNGCKILLAEDNRTNQLIIQSLLKSTGVELTIASDGNEAVAFYKGNQPDLVLMDVSMPGKSGLDATDQIRQFENRTGATYCPIIALTAHASLEDQNACFAAGMDGFLSKPVRKAELVQKMQTFLAGWDLAAAIDGQQQLQRSVVR